MNTRKKLLGLAFSVLLLATVMLPIQKASAATVGATFDNIAYWHLESLTFTDADIGGALVESVVLEVGTNDRARGIQIINSYVLSQGVGRFFDSNATDSLLQYEKNGCGTQRMRFQNGNYQLVNLSINFPNVGCRDILNNDIVLTAGMIDGDRNTLFAFNDADTIIRVDGQGGNFELTDPTNFPNTYFSSSAGYVEVIGGTAGQYFVSGNSIGQFGVIPYSGSPYVPPGGGSIGGPGGGGGSNSPLPPSCANSSDGGPLRWIFCPLLERLDKGLGWLEEKVQDLLYVKNPISDGTDGSISQGSSDALRKSWSRFRNIALIVLVPIMLVMIIGTAVGANAFDAYTIRRAMPRFLIAIVFISVSWYFTSFLINLTNVVGIGIQGLMLAPFTLPDGTALSDARTISQLLTATNAAAGFAGGATILTFLTIGGAITTGVVLSFGLVFFVSLAVGWFILTMRQMLIYALVLAAPLAILSWIFPNNDKLWKIWWGTFSTLLIMYPLLMIVIAATKIFAYVIATL